jgi:hypothetical protein
VRYLFVLVLAASCTCFTPVDEFDGGTGGGAAGGSGGSGGGNTAGGAGGGSTGGGSATSSDGGCTTAAQCTGTRASVPFCGPAGGAGWSCVANACLWECNGGRVCDVTQTPDGGCLTCGTPGTTCRDRFCADGLRLADVESSTCNLSGTIQLIGTGCRYGVQGDAGVFGTLELLQGGEILANLGTHGGLCTGTFLPTGLERWVLNCPQCQFVVRF